MSIGDSKRDESMAISIRLCLSYNQTGNAEKRQEARKSFQKKEGKSLAVTNVMSTFAPHFSKELSDERELGQACLSQGERSRKS